MKRFTPIITFFAGCCFTLLISAKNQSTPAVEVPRYHTLWVGQSTDVMVYDAVTGNYKIVGYKKLKENNNLKQL
jgi:hypothetical protein